MYLLQYKHEKVHASDDKSIKMNHATLIMKQNAAARWHCNAEYLMQRRISDVIFNDLQKIDVPDSLQHGLSFGLSA